MKKEEIITITTSTYMFPVYDYLKDNIARTGLVWGMSMKREFVKNSNLRLASKFLGIFAAESLIVNREYNLLTCALCI